jgi:hypothetical protein
MRELRAPDLTAEHKELSPEQRVLGHELDARAGMSRMTEKSSRSRSTAASTVARAASVFSPLGTLWGVDG